MRDDLNQSQNDNNKEIDDFLKQFHKPEKVEDSFNQITDRFEKKYGTGPLNSEEVEKEASPVSETADEASLKQVTSNRMERLRSKHSSGILSGRSSKPKRSERLSG